VPPFTVANFNSTATSTTERYFKPSQSLIPLRNAHVPCETGWSHPSTVTYDIWSTAPPGQLTKRRSVAACESVPHLMTAPSKRPPPESKCPGMPEEGLWKKSPERTRGQLYSLRDHHPSIRPPRAYWKIPIVFLSVASSRSPGPCLRLS
jgi:hypothetical protein